MAEQNYSPGRTPPRRGGGRRVLLALVLLAALGGAGAVGWLAWDGQLHVDVDSSGIVIEPRKDDPPAAPPAPAPAPQTLVGGSAAALDQKIAALDSRVAQLGLKAEAAAGQAGRAEALLVALAVRRAVERGQPLGYLEPQLRQRFAAGQAAAVAVLTEGGARPLTRDELLARFDRLAPTLVNRAAGSGGWTRIRREFAELFTVRREAPGARTPASQLDSARAMIQTGRLGEAAQLVAALPGAGGAADWLAEARRSAAAERALEAIEAAALSQPVLVDAAAGLPDMTGAAAALPDADPAASPAAAPSPALQPPDF